MSCKPDPAFQLAEKSGAVHPFRNGSTGIVIHNRLLWFNVVPQEATPGPNPWPQHVIINNTVNTFTRNLHPKRYKNYKHAYTYSLHTKATPNYM